MKTVIKYISLILLYILHVGCTIKKNSFDTELVIIIDKTDKVMTYPAADEITSQLGLKDNPYQSVRITASYISDSDINDATVLTLPGESQWNGNIVLRKTKIRHFAKQLQDSLNAIKHSGTRPYSIVYRTIARQANRLAASNAGKRYLLVYSDLYENDGDLNFYNPHTIDRLQKTPQSVVRQLEATVPLNALNGLQVCLIYSPASFAQNNGYMAIAGFYQRMFERHGAVTHIGDKFLLP